MADALLDWAARVTRAARGGQVGRTTHPRLQLRMIEELLAGKGIDYPQTRANVTFKKAPRVETNAEQLSLSASPAAGHDYDEETERSARMAKVSAYHTNSTEYAPEHRNVHHDHDDCKDGKRILSQHRLKGTGDKPRCKECTRLG